MAEFFRITRVRPNGSEQLIRDVYDLTREEVLDDVRARRDSGLHVRLYSSSNEQVIPDEDRIWDSELNE